MKIQAQFPEKLSFLFGPKRYKVAYGGRGSAKSWSFARALLIKGAQRPLRILCAREIQDSIADSVHKLLDDQIADLKLAGFYDVQKTKIYGPKQYHPKTREYIGRTEFSFEGLRHNINSLKSFEGADIVWVEEANKVSRNSWNVLIPTIRKEGSEIWVTFNPELETDETYQRFVINPPSDSVVCKVSWRDNPWFPKVLYQEMIDLKRRDPDSWLNVWEGNTIQVLSGAIYAEQLRKVIEEGRRTRVPYDPAKPVSVYFDLGRSDMTSLWFAQFFPFERRMIDYHQDTGHDISHYIKFLQGLPYTYDAIWLPHDARHKTIVHKLSVEQQMRQAFPDKVFIVPNISREDGINAARLAMATTVFDAEKTADGWQSLTHYVYRVSDDGTRSKEPMHNWASHGADSFRYYAVAGQPPRRPKLNMTPLRDKVVPTSMGSRFNPNAGWMGS